MDVVLHSYVPLDKFDWSFNRVGPLPWSPAVYSLIAAFSALAIWSSFPLTARILFTWPRRSFKSLYFRAIMVTSWGLCIRELGFVLRICVPAVPWILSLTLIELGWISMVTGFSVVLYSRLRYLCLSTLTRRLVLAMIVTSAATMHTILVVLQFGLAAAGGAGRDRRPWLRAINPMERIQVSWFTVQEVIISLLYMRAACQYFQGRADARQKVRKAMVLLLTVQAIVIALDIIIVVVDCAGYFNLKAIIHSFVYAIKLELEMAVLDQLRDMSQMGVCGLTSVSDDTLAASSSQGEKSLGGTGTTTTPTTPAFLRLDSDGSMDASLIAHAHQAASAKSEPITPMQFPDSIPTPVRQQGLGLNEAGEDDVIRPQALNMDSIGVLPKI